MKNIKLLVLFLMITSNFSFGQCEKKINDYIQMIKSMSCVDVNNQNSQAMKNFDRVGKELANSCTTTFLQRGEEIKKATIDKVNSCGSNINSNSQSNNQSNNNYNSTYNSKSSSNSKNSSGSVGTSSMNRGGNIVTENSNSQNQNNPQEELARQQQEKIRLQQEKTNQEVEKANQQLAEIKKRKEDAIKLIEQESQVQLNKNLENATNILVDSYKNGLVKSEISKKNNDNEIKNAQQEFNNFNLSNEEIDSLLINSTSKDYAIIRLYNSLSNFGGTKVFPIINGYKAQSMKKNQKMEYRIYIGNKLLIQLDFKDFTRKNYDLYTYTKRIRKGEVYNFEIKVKDHEIVIEELEKEPIDKKGKMVVYESISTKIKSDIDN